MQRSASVYNSMESHTLGKKITEVQNGNKEICNKGGGEAVWSGESQLVSDGTLMGQQCFGVKLRSVILYSSAG